MTNSERVNERMEQGFQFVLLDALPFCVGACFGLVFIVIPLALFIRAIMALSKVLP